MRAHLAVRFAPGASCRTVRRSRSTWRRAPLLCGVLVLAGCLFPDKETDCTRHACPEGQQCDTSGQCVQKQPSTQDMSLVDASMMVVRDMSVPDLTQPDLTIPPDLRPECVVDDDCGAAAGLACKNNKCGTCQLHDDCTSKVCDIYQMNMKGEAGRCLLQASVVYVDNNNGGACTSGTGDAPKTALCTVAEAVTRVDGTKKVVRVMASSKDYGQLTIMGKTLSLFGPADTGAGKTSQFTAATDKDVVTLGGAITVTLDGVEITGGQRGIAANATGQLTVRRSQITNASGLGGGGYALSIVNCGLVLDRCLITGNQNGAMELFAVPTYSLTNNFIVKNKNSTNSNAIAISPNSDGAGVFRFNTVADNTGGDQLIDCSVATAHELKDSIIVGNKALGAAGAKTQFGGNCTLTNTVIGSGDIGLGIKKNPVFVSPATGDYRLDTGAGVAANTDCCIDKAMGTIDHDYFGTKRPLGGAGGYDIGAHEAK